MSAGFVLIMRPFQVLRGNPDSATYPETYPLSDRRRYARPRSLVRRH
jgi:hypothetical protein